MLASSICRNASGFRCVRFAPFRSSCVPACRTVATRAHGSERVVKVAHILLSKDQEPLADEIDAELAGGAPFEDLARKHSSCGSARRGGELGWLNRGSFFPQFEATAFAAPVGGVCRATTDRGLHVIKVLAERFQAPVQHMSPQELFQLLGSPAAATEAQLVDVREEWEWQTARLPGFRLMPLSRASEWSAEVGELLDPQRETVVLCHHGVRSMQMAQFLVQNGFVNVKNVTGGIDSYSRVDPTVPLY